MQSNIICWRTSEFWRSWRSSMPARRSSYTRPRRLRRSERDWWERRCFYPAQPRSVTRPVTATDFSCSGAVWSSKLRSGCCFPFPLWRRKHQAPPVFRTSGCLSLGSRLQLCCFSDPVVPVQPADRFWLMLGKILLLRENLVEVLVMFCATN